MTDQPHSADGAPIPDCPRCQGPMWDNRVGKRNPRAPDFKCKDRGCDGVIWPPRGAVPSAAPSPSPAPGTTPAVPNAVPGATRPGGPAPAGRAVAAGMPACPICGGPMWDDRASKRNPRAPDFKCRNKPKERGGPGCEGVIWPSRDGSSSPYPASPPRRAEGADGDSPLQSGASSWATPPVDDAPPHDDDDLPF